MLRTVCLAVRHAALMPPTVDGGEEDSGALVDGVVGEVVGEVGTVTGVVGGVMTVGAITLKLETRRA